jgi:hypothetical protein
MSDVERAGGSEAPFEVRLKTKPALGKSPSLEMPEKALQMLPVTYTGAVFSSQVLRYQSLADTSTL